MDENEEMNKNKQLRSDQQAFFLKIKCIKKNKNTSIYLICGVHVLHNAPEGLHIRLGLVIATCIVHIGFHVCTVREREQTISVVR